MFNTKHSKNQSNLVLSAVCASVLTALFILASKVFAWYLTNSSTVLASFIDSFLDITASFINYIAVRYSRRPPDNEHRFGHERAEDLAVFIQSSLFAISGIFILIQSVKRLIIPKAIEREDIAIYVMVFSIVLTSLLVLYQRYVYSQTRSKIIKCDSLHYSIDLFTNFFVIIALYLSYKFKNYSIDPIFAGIIAIYMLFGAFRLLIPIFNNLMDHEFDEVEKKKLHKIILSHKDVKGYHDLKTRHAGCKSFIQLHLELDRDISLRKAHRIGDVVEEMIRKEFRGVEIIIHQDPEGVEEKVQFHD